MLIVCGKLIEGFDRKEISVVGILRNVGKNSVVLFSQFVGRCVRFHPNDPKNFKGCIVSHKAHDQKENFENLESVIADDDPIDDDPIDNEPIVE